jgi:hypothetical protein
VTVKKEFAVYCTDRGDHKRRRIATAYLGVKPTGETTVSVAYNTFRRKPRDPVTQQLSDPTPNWRGLQMWFDKDRQVYVIDCHRCRPTDLPEHAKPKRRYISARRLGSLLLIVRDAPGPNNPDISYYT